MTLPFYKLQVAGDDFILVDLDRAARGGGIIEQGELGKLALLMADRRCGIGAASCIFVWKTSDRLEALVYGNDGKCTETGSDPLFCVARWAFDAGYGQRDTIRVWRSNREFVIHVVDSRLFSLAMPTPELNRMTLIVDGKVATSYSMEIGVSYSVAIAGREAPGPKRVRMALQAMGTHTTPVVVRPQGKDLFRYTGSERIDRADAALASALTALAQGRIANEAIAEWRGRGGAVSYAHFGEESDSSATILIDRGRFWIERRNTGIFLLTGMAEYAFEGNFDT